MKYVLFIVLIFIFYKGSANGNRGNSQEDSTDLYTYAKADFYLEKGNYSEALRLYSLVDRNLNRSYLYFKKGICEFMLNSSLASIKSMTICERLFPSANRADGGYFRESLSYMYIEGMDDYTIAEKFTSLEHSYDQIYAYRGIAKADLKDYYGSVQDLSKYHTLAKDSSVYTCDALGLSYFNIKKSV